MFSSALRKVTIAIDRLSDVVAYFVKYLILVLIFVLIYEVAARYVFNKPTVWALETSQMVFGSIGALCWGYTLKIGGHVRVDVFYTLLSVGEYADRDCKAYDLHFPFPDPVYSDSFRDKVDAVRLENR